MSSDRTTAERVTLLVSSLVLVGLVSLVVWANARTGDAPPDIRVEAHIEQVRESETGYYVPITITNTGGNTAQNATVTGELTLSDGSTESGDVTIDFLAGGETEQATLVFSQDPSEGELTLMPVSYQIP